MPSTRLADSAAGVQIADRQDMAHAHMLTLFIATGLVFMLVPGTLLGVWNLLQVSERQSVSLVPPAWLQAHGHAQVFGWVATFILGIGFFSIPVVRAGAPPSLAAARACWAMWTTGVTLRWTAAVYEWQWRALLPISGVLELAAFAIFFHAVSRHRPAARGPGRLDPWIHVVIAAAIGLATTLVLNLLLVADLAWRGASPAVPHGHNQLFLAVATWGFLAPFIWGFSSKWLPVLLGLRPVRSRGVTFAVLLNAAAVVLTLAGYGDFATLLFACAAGAVAVSLRLFEPTVQPPKTRGVHVSFPVFVRIAYVWMLVAAALGIVAAQWDVSGGLWGASRHAFTVGFVSAMVFSIGQRVLPAFAAVRPLWSPRLMFAGLLLLNAGCVLRVVSEIIAYQGGASWWWSVLPASAVVELFAVSMFALNMFATFLVETDPGG